ncbi:MAG TPA: DUF1592 domain-containing protein, partial [Phycisphaerae bacterium]
MAVSAGGTSAAAAGSRGGGNANGGGKASAADLDHQFTTTMQPFLETYCISCHSGKDAPSGLDLSYTSPAMVEHDAERLSRVIARLKAGEMPPKEADKTPPANERQQAIAWADGFRTVQIAKHAGDPGVVLAHRLSNSEYNYVIRDLTGVDINPTKEFPVDPANQAGFDNSGESLMMEPELLKKYMEAAREVSEHLVLKADGLGFAADPAISITDRDKYAVNRILAFYDRQPMDIGMYLLAAWRYENRAALKKPGATLETFGAELKLSTKYLAQVYAAIMNPEEKIGPLAGLKAMWKTLPMPDYQSPDVAADGCGQIAAWVRGVRDKVKPAFPNLSAPGMQTGSQPFVIWKDVQMESTRLTYSPGTALKLTGPALAPGTAAETAMAIPSVPEEQEQYEAAFTRFCAVFPDVFVVRERAPVYLSPTSSEGSLKGHLLSAGLHSQTGYFRDDRPLYDLILSDEGRKELDAMWKDFDVITGAPVRQFQSMIWFERSDSQFMVNKDFDFVRTEDQDFGDEAKFSKLRETFLKDLSARATPQSRQAVSDYFNYMHGKLKATEENLAAAEPTHLTGLQDFAARAYRRPLTQAEKDDIAGFYKTLRTEGGETHDEAMRDSLVSILMSPYFCYRMNLPAATSGVAALTDGELASRLSFFLWSSIPDDGLLKHVAAGDLHKPEVVKGEVHRMLKDDKIAAMAVEFGGNWLDFRRFEEHNGVDRERFPSFDNKLREAMFQEPIHFLMDTIRNDQSVLNFIYGDYTFVDAPLAKLYGMPAVQNDPGEDRWVKVDNAHEYDRGGLLPMAVFMTKNAPGLRTSPVKRGYWVVKRLLGEEIPAPPPNVPVLPADESKLGDLTLPQLLAKHREDPSCATCHVHFDAVGLSFEGYGPIGERRTADGGGKPVQNQATFRDGTVGTGLTGLRDYL